MVKTTSMFVKSTTSFIKTKALFNKTKALFNRILYKRGEAMTASPIVCVLKLFCSDYFWMNFLPFLITRPL